MKLNTLQVVDNLISLLKKVTHEQKNALSNLIKYWVINKDVGTELVLVRIKKMYVTLFEETELN